MPKESLETLVTELVHEEDWRRMRATAACIAGGPKAVAALIHALETGSAALKIEAAGMLARLKDPHGGVPLVRLLADADPGVRKAGAAALEQMAGVMEIETAAALVDALHTSDEEQRAVVRGLLGVIPNAIEPLSAMMRHADPSARQTAAEILEHLLDPRSAEAFVDAMTEPGLQEISVRALKKLGAIRARIEETFDALRNVEEFSLREESRMAAVEQLLGIGRPSVEILIEYLEDEDWVVREAAADLLGKIGDVRAVGPLMKRLDADKDTGVKELAVKALGLIGDPRPVEQLVELIPIRPLRVFAIEALAKIKDCEKLQQHADLFERLKSDRDGLVSYNAGVIVEKLKAMAMQAESQQEQDAEPDE